MSVYILNQDPAHLEKLGIGQMDALAKQLGLPKYSALTKPAPQGMPSTLQAGIEAAARWVDQRREDFYAEHGHTDPDTGAVEYGSGPNGQIALEYDLELSEIAGGIRALATAPTVPQAEPPQPAPPIIANVMMDNGGEQQAYCLMAAWPRKEDALAALAAIGGKLPEAMPARLPQAERPHSASQEGAHAAVPFGPNNPPPLRRKGESVADYRARCGWDKPTAARAAPTQMDDVADGCECANCANGMGECQTMITVRKEDANNYCLILRALGMEDEGDPVAEVIRLVAAQGGQEIKPVAFRYHPKGMGNIDEIEHQHWALTPFDPRPASRSVVEPLYTHPPRTQGDTEMLDFMEHHRVLVTPEYEGPWEARVYGENEKPTITGVGKTPRAALADAITRKGGKGGAA